MRKILIVEDELGILDLLTTVLEEEGYAVQGARNGREGLERLKRDRPDLVLCDLMMPQMDGCELFQKMQAEPALSSIPFLLMSAVRSDSRRVQSCGLDVALNKPFDLTTLIRTVSEALGRSVR